MSNTSATIVTWNSEKIIEECVRSLLNQTTKLLEIVIVDNNSSDHTCELVTKKFGNKVTLLRQNKNTGFAKGNNIGIKHAFKNTQCQNIVFVNADARLGKTWLANIIAVIQKDNTIVAAQGVTLNYYDHNKVDALGIQLNQRGQAIQLGFNEMRKSKYYDHDIFGVNAAAALYTRKFLEAQPFKDVFDETLYMYYEDVDLALRAQVMNGRSRFVANATAYHMGSVSKVKVRAERLMVRNAGLILIKNIPPQTLKKVLPGFMKVQTHRVFGHAKRGQWNLFFASLLGCAQGVLLVPVFLYKRHKLRQLRTIDPAELWNRM